MAGNGVYCRAPGGMFWSAMKLPRTLALTLVLMLAAAVPLRGYAAMAQCEGSASSAVQAGHSAHCADGAGSAHLGGCSDCCSAAAASAAVRWAIPRAPASGIAAPSIWPPPALVPHRLDRPPRLHG